MKNIHIQYKQETGNDVPRMERYNDPELLYVEWLEEQLMIVNVGLSLIKEELQKLEKKIK